MTGLPLSRTSELVDLVAHRIDVPLHGNPSMGGPRNRSRRIAALAVDAVVAEVVAALRNGHAHMPGAAADFIEREFGTAS